MSEANINEPLDRLIAKLKEIGEDKNQEALELSKRAALLVAKGESATKADRKDLKYLMIGLQSMVHSVNFRSQKAAKLFFQELAEILIEAAFSAISKRIS